MRWDNGCSTIYIKFCFRINTMDAKFKIWSAHPEIWFWTICTFEWNGSLSWKRLSNRSIVRNGEMIPLTNWCYTVLLDSVNVISQKDYGSYWKVIPLSPDSYIRCHANWFFGGRLLLSLVRTDVPEVRIPFYGDRQTIVLMTWTSSRHW